MVADHHLWSQGFRSDFILTAKAASTPSVAASSAPESSTTAAAPAKPAPAASSSPAAAETAAAETTTSAASSEASLALGLGVVQGHLVAVDLTVLHGFFGGLAVLLVVEVHKAKAGGRERAHSEEEVTQQGQRTGDP